MGYFGAGIGERVNANAKQSVAPSEDAPAPNFPSAKPFFAAALGARPQMEKPLPTPSAAAAPIATICPLCRGETQREDGLIVCIGRCQARWLEDAPGRLIDVAALPFGVCACCDSRQVLAGAAWGAICPKGGRGYLLLPGGPSPIDEAAPDGLCACCAPPAPLVWEEDRLVCSRKRERIYKRKGGETTAEKGTGTPGSGTQSEFIEAIDAALHANSAQLTVFGLFDVT